MTQAQKLQLAVKWITSESESESRKTYPLLVRKHDDLAIDCGCRDRAKRGRKAGRGCKHMRRHNQAVRDAKKLAIAGIMHQSAYAHVPTMSVSDVALKAILNSNRGFSLMR